MQGHFLLVPYLVLGFEDHGNSLFHILAFMMSVAKKYLVMYLLLRSHSWHVFLH